MNRQIKGVGLVMMVLFLALFVQVNYLQIIKAEDLNKHPANTRAIVRDFSRPRGVIQTSDGVVLAQSVPTDNEFERLRQYPEGDLFSHLTGYFSFTFGTDGVERTYNDDLAGRSPRFTRIRDVLNEEVRTGDVTLTISKRLQEVARQQLGQRKGAVVALNPTDGSVLALWSYPSFDPNPLAAHSQRSVQDAWQRLQVDADKPLLARSYRERYPPGSTFKVVTASAALERAPDLVSKDYPRLSRLDLPQTNRDLPNFGGSTCGGSLPELLRRSCNTGFAQMGLDLGGDKLAGEARDFGFAARPPLDLPAVATSVFPEATSFARNKPALAQSAIGQQDVTASPLQMALVAAGVANGGVVMRPHIMKEVHDNEGALARAWNPEPWRRAMSPGNAAALTDMMVGVVKSGTATAAAVPGVEVAAKTGTAQTTGENSHAWLVAFAPARAPTVAVAVIVESQPGLGDTITGGRVAAPIAKAVLAAALEGRP